MSWSRVARLSFAIAVLVGAPALVYGLVALLNGPIRAVVVTAPLPAGGEQALRAAIAGRAREGILLADVHAIANDLRRLDWVAQAEVRRRWPDRLWIGIELRTPVARWGEERLIAADGRLMDLDLPAAESARLPLLSGEPSDAPLVMRRFRLISKLLRPLGVEVVELRVDASRGWRMRLSNGIRVEFGSGDVGERVRRFLALYAGELHQRAALVEVVDLRYADGAAVAWRHARVAVRGPSSG